MADVGKQRTPRRQCRFRRKAHPEAFDLVVVPAGLALVVERAQRV